MEVTDRVTEEEEVTEATQTEDIKHLALTKTAAFFLKITILLN